MVNDVGGLPVHRAANIPVAGWAEAITAAWQKSLAGILECGRLLIEAKAALPHGEWLSMFDKELPGSRVPFGEDTAQCLMKIVRDKRLSNTEHARYLPPSWYTLYELTKLDDGQWQYILDEGLLTPNLDRKTLNDALRTRQRGKNDAIRAAAMAIMPPEDKYRCIIIDPPWPVEKFEREVRPNQTAPLDYPTMTHEEIADLDVAALAADDGCHLFCWTTQKHLPATLNIARIWGFEYCLLMVWHKPGGPQPFGLPQYNCEFVVYARRNSPKFRDLTQFFACFQAARREHSRKPDEFYDVIRRVTDGPRVDVFSREKREGFEQVGAETSRFIS